MILSCSSCISCYLLLPIKEYGEVLVEIRGSSHACTGKFTCLYGEVHKERTGKCGAVLDLQQPLCGKAYREVHRDNPCGFRSVNSMLLYGEVHTFERGWLAAGRRPGRTGKFYVEADSDGWRSTASHPTKRGALLGFPLDGHAHSSTGGVRHRLRNVDPRQRQKCLVARVQFFIVTSA